MAESQWPETGGKKWSSFDLVSLNYRQLQGKAKELELPGNLKYDVLVKVIEARCYGNEDLVRKILANEQDIRLRKKEAKKRFKCSFCPKSSCSLSSPRIKQVGRPRKKSVDNSFISCRSQNSRHPESDIETRRTSSICDIDKSSSARGCNAPIAHSIHQLLLDKRVPNAALKKQVPYSIDTPTSTFSDRFSFKPSNGAFKDHTRGGGLMYDANLNWQLRQPWENGSAPLYGNPNISAPTGLDYLNSNHSELKYYNHFPGFGHLGPQVVGNNDLNTSGEYMSDFDNLSMLPLNISESSMYQPPPPPLPPYHPIYLHQDFWPSQSNASNMSYQFPTPFSSQTMHHDDIWNPAEYSSYFNNPSLGYSEEVVISETQNSDTLSAPENPEAFPPLPAALSEKDNQVYWPKTDSSCSGLVSSTSLNNSGNQLRNNNDYEKGALPHMRMSVVDTHEWTFEYTSSSNIFAQQLL